MVADRVINEKITIGLSSQLVLGRDPLRKCWSIQNTSAGAQVISISQSNDQGAEDRKGIVLGPGQAYTDSDMANYDCWDGDIYVISDIAGAQISLFSKSGVLV